MEGVADTTGTDLATALAERLEAEAALLAAALPAALAWAVAGLVARAGGPRSILVPLGQLGRLEAAPLAALIGLGGGTPLPVGTVRDCPEAELERALAEPPAAALLVLEPELPELVAPARFLWLCRRAHVPAVILDPGSGRWAAWADGGASLVLLDGRALAGVEAGVLAGTAAAIAACRATPVAAAFRAPEPVRVALAAALAAPA
jgi:seryl-tRNA(Sec) selenium transferase